ncbi:MAG: RNA polymerase sigma factor [Armatimonadetes bacterium]|nr:RNA polymerase sigma factor [Armatimonadota bacterium]
MNRAQAGERVAFELLADTYRGQLLAVAYRQLHNTDDANDAVQEALYKAFRAIHAFTPGRPLLPWLSRICSNCCIDILRSRKAETDSIDKYEFALDDGNDYADDVEQSIQGSVVMASVNRLPRHYREIFMMRHFRHMEVGEIAAAVNRPEGTIKSWLFRSRKLLRKELEPMFGAA